MFVPITSEVTIGRGTVLKEIATEKLFTVTRRIVKDAEVFGEPVWEVNKVEGNEPERKEFGYLELAERFLAQEEK